jgi:hypothetical protein
VRCARAPACCGPQTSRAEGAAPFPHFCAGGQLYMSSTPKLPSYSGKAKGGGKLWERLRARNEEREQNRLAAAATTTAASGNAAPASTACGQLQLPTRWRIRRRFRP